MLEVLLAFSLLFAEQDNDARVSWYGGEFHGRQTANGETYDCFEYTAASPTLPFNTRLLIMHGERSVLVRVNDRGPFVTDSLGRARFPLCPHPSRSLDLSRAAFAALLEDPADTLQVGVLDVQYKNLGSGKPLFDGPQDFYVEPELRGFAQYSIPEFEVWQGDFGVSMKLRGAYDLHEVCEQKIIAACSAGLQDAIAKLMQECRDV